MVTTVLVGAIHMGAALIRASAHDCPCGGGCGTSTPSFLSHSDRRAVFLTGLGFKASRFKPPQFRHHTPALFCHWSVVSNIA
jgi:hypothetical protein